MNGNGFTVGFPLKEVPEHECLVDSCFIGTENGESEFILLFPLRHELLGSIRLRFYVLDNIKLARHPVGDGILYFLGLRKGDLLSTFLVCVWNGIHIPGSSGS